MAPLRILEIGYYVTEIHVWTELIKALHLFGLST